jgi:pimeloyl-ACP methyl ester carboxylesterase
VPDPLHRPSLVLLSGMLGDASLWDGVCAELGDAVRPVPVRIDRDDSVFEMAESVLAAAPPTFALAGHSLGGIVALEVQRRAPERVTWLVLVANSARGPSTAQHEAWAGWRRRTEAGEFAAVAAELAVATLGPSRRDDPQLRAANLAMAGTVGAEGFLRQLAAQDSRPDSRDRLGELTVPTLVVSGAEDDVCPPELQAEIVRLCPSATPVTLPGGHMLPLECPRELAGVLAQHAPGWLLPDQLPDQLPGQ